MVEQTVPKLGSRGWSTFGWWRNREEKRYCFCFTVSCRPEYIFFYESMMSSVAHWNLKLCSIEGSMSTTFKPSALTIFISSVSIFTLKKCSCLFFICCGHRVFCASSSRSSVRVPPSLVYAVPRGEIPEIPPHQSPPCSEKSSHQSCKPC